MAVSYLEDNVYNASISRIHKIFECFDHVIITFSGGKDSGAMLNLALAVGDKIGFPARVDLLHLDYEAQWTETTGYVNRVFANLPNNIHGWRVCLPFKAGCATNNHGFWRPWDEEKRNIWCRERPVAHTEKDFPFFTRQMTDYAFQRKAAAWLHDISGADNTAVLVGVRGSESLTRRAAITRADRRQNGMWRGERWTVQISAGVYNVYPIWDWQVEDIWTAHAREGWDYNKVYDAFHLLGIAPYAQRTSSPYHAAALSQLPLYPIIDPAAWHLISRRVPGVLEALARGPQKRAPATRKNASKILEKWLSL